jgi:hypothetical protein
VLQHYPNVFPLVDFFFGIVPLRKAPFLRQTGGSPEPTEK